MTLKPTLIFVHGAWHSPSCFSHVIDLLSTAGYKSICVTLPSVGAEPPLKSFDPDVHAIQSAISTAVDADGEDVIVIMHSYGGSPGSEAIKGFTKVAREGRGKKGGVVRVVYLCAYTLSIAQCTWEIPRGEGSMARPVRIDGDYIYPQGPVKVAEYFYNDLPRTEGVELARGLQYHSLPVFSSKVTYAPWMDVPSSYLICELDNALPPAMQEGMVSAAKAVEPKSFGHVERLEASHSPFLSRPKETAAFLERAARYED